MPSGAVHEQNSLRALGDVAGYLVEMKLHGFGIGVWHGESRTGSACRTDGAKQIGILVALVGRLAGS